MKILSRAWPFCAGLAIGASGAELVHGSPASHIAGLWLAGIVLGVAVLTALWFIGRAIDVLTRPL